MRIFSTFSGIGGFEIGIERAFMRSQGQGQPTETSTGDSEGLSEQLPQLGLERLSCVGYSEIDKYAIKVYERNFTKHVCDRAEQTEQRARTAAGRSSLYSESRGIGNEESNCNCERPKNYGDITKIRAEELPDFDCLVGGFPCQAFSIAGKRKGFEDTRGTLFFDLARILRAKQPRLFVFENVKGLLSHDGGQTFKTIIQTIDELGYDCQWQVLNSKNHGVPQNRERVYIVGHLRGTPRPEVFPIGESNETPALDSKQRSGIRDGAVSNAIDANYYKGHDGKRQLIDNGIKIRRLTPIECERLQGFPDNWTAQGIDGAISATQRYKMCGNAVTTNVVQAVFERIFESTMEANNDQL